MKAQQILFALAVVFLFVCPAHANAGTLQFQFTMTDGFINGGAPDPSFFGSGIFTTTTLQPGCPNDTIPHYTVLNISGTFNGFAMSQPTGAGICGDDLTQLGPSLEPTPAQSIVVFNANGIKWGIEFDDFGSGPEPEVVTPFNSNTVPSWSFDLTVTPIQTPEPASLSSLALGLLVLEQFRRRTIP